jgi:hypothetical protein
MVEKLVLQTEFPDLPGMQIDSGGYTGLTHGGVPIGSIIICGNTRQQAGAFVESRGRQPTPGIVKPV